MIIKDDQEAYQQLKSQQAEIEEEMGESLIWSSPEEAQRNSNRAKITLRRPGVLSEKTSWEEYHQWMIEHGELFYEIFHDRIQSLP